MTFPKNMDATVGLWSDAFSNISTPPRGEFLGKSKDRIFTSGRLSSPMQQQKNRKDIFNYEILGGEGGGILLRLPWMVVVVLSTRLVSMLNPNTVLTFESMVPFRVMLSSGK